MAQRKEKRKGDGLEKMERTKDIKPMVVESRELLNVRKG